MVKHLHTVNCELTSMIDHNAELNINYWSSNIDVYLLLKGQYNFIMIQKGFNKTSINLG